MAENRNNDRKLYDWEVKMIQKIEESNNDEHKEVLRTILAFDADGSDAITDEQVEELTKKIDSLTGILSSVRKSLHRKLKILVEGDGKRLAKWEVDFIKEVEESENEEAKDLLNKMNAVEGNETEENVNDIEHDIEYAKISDELRGKFQRKARLLRNRIERSISENFGSLIKHLRESKGYSLKDMQTATGISSSYINRIEKGERKAPSIQIITKLAVALDQDVAELLNVANSQEQVELQTVEEVLLANNFMVGGKRATKETRERLVDLISKITNSDWETNKHFEAMEIMEAIDRYKESLDKKK
ncbi:helix-turn-helix domain-containing protein [Brevibacillus sp. NPDC058079]|uniref:helix-turn-helix domain-containing protein n=1 Tax=Brevibacillus sp. NPDC058079 TaxID=3346330 RepID=UPI0036E84B4A